MNANLNKKQQLFLGAVAAAGEVESNLSPEAFTTAKKTIFDAQGHVQADWTFWNHIFLETCGRLAQLSIFKASSEGVVAVHDTRFPAPQKPTPATAPVAAVA